MTDDAKQQKKAVEINIGGLDADTHKRFIDYLKARKGVPPEQLVEMWNLKVVRPEECVFITSKADDPGMK